MQNTAIAPSVLHDFLNELRFSLTTMRRYLFDTVVGLLTVYVLFLVIFFGLKTFVSGQFNSAKLDALIVGYLMWMFAVSGYSSASTWIIDEARQGTLEQLFMAPGGFKKLLLMRLIVGLGTSFVFNVALVILAMLTTGRWLDIPVVQTTVLICLGMPAVWGVGFIIAGLALLFKRVSAIAGVMQFALIAMVSVPALPLGLWSLLPFSLAANVVNQLVVQQSQVPFLYYLLIALCSAVYLAIGMGVFHLFAIRTMKLNVLGHY